MKSKLFIRDSHATLNKDDTIHELPSGGLQIIAQDGSTLFEICIREGGAIEVRAGNVCKHDGAILDDAFLIRPEASNVIVISKPACK